METIVNYISGQEPLIIYALLIFLIFCENTIPFLPGDLILIITALLSVNKIINPGLGFSITILAATLGFVFVFLIGSHWGRPYFEKKKHHFLSLSKIKRGDRYLQKHGKWMLAIARLIPGFRFFIALSAGFSKLAVFSSVILTLTSIILWNTLIFILVKYVNGNWDEIRHVISNYNQLIITCLIIFIITIFIIKQRSRINRETVT